MTGDYFGIAGSTLAGVYRVESVVAESPFGVVYRAFREDVCAPVALKCLKLPRELSDAERHAFLGRFRAQAALLFQLSALSPAVVRPLQAATFVAADGTVVPFLALEWLEGRGLDVILEDRARKGLAPFGLSKVVNALGPAAHALALAHRFSTPNGIVSIVHHEVNPRHLFLVNHGGERFVKLLDVGIATVRGTTPARGRENNVAPFSASYTAPEQWAPDRDGATGPSTDVWALALSVLAIASGEAVFRGSAEAIRTAAWDPQRRPSPRSCGLSGSDAVNEVFSRALSVDPAARFADAGAFWQALEEAVDAELADLSDRDSLSLSDGLPMPLTIEGLPYGGARPSTATSPPNAETPANLQGVAVGESATSTIEEAALPSKRATTRWRGYRGAVAATLVGSLLLGVDQAYAIMTGSLLGVGPLRLTWPAGLLTLSGLGWAVHEWLLHRTTNTHD